MMTDTFKDIEQLESALWEAADNLRANSKLTSSDYFMPVLGVIFLRHAANRFDAAHRQIEADRVSGKMPKRKVQPADYIARRSLYLPESARYDAIMQQAAVSGADLPKLVTAAMTAIEAEFEPLVGVLPKDYGIFETKVLEDLMRLFNSEQIKRATGDVFGRIYEYFLAKFSIQKAHDNGEFFTPSSIVQTIVNVIEPDHGTVFDPACFRRDGKLVEEYATGDDEETGEGGGIVAPLEELVASLLQAIEAAEGHLSDLGFDAGRLAGAAGFSRIQALRDAVDALYTSDEAKRRFEIMARQVFARFKALLMEPSVFRSAERHDNIEAIYKKLEEKRDTADVTEYLEGGPGAAEASQQKLARIAPAGSGVDAGLDAEHFNPGPGEGVHPG